MIRKAKMQDVKHIHEILNKDSNRDLLLTRSLSELYDHLRDFYVAAEGVGAGRLLGICSLSICWENVGEIRSLAVIEETRERGLGSGLVEACLSEAKALGLSEVFVLTLEEGFFARFGFQVAEKSLLPHKIWSDCIKCPKFPYQCDEIVMILRL